MDDFWSHCGIIAVPLPVGIIWGPFTRNIIGLGSLHSNLLRIYGPSALRVRIIFDRVSFLVYFLKYLWSITGWDNFRLCIISGLYSKVVMFNHTLGSILIEYHVRSNLLKVCFVASYHFFNLGSSLVQYGGYFLSTNGIIFGWVFVSRINFSLMITKAEKIVTQHCH